MLDPEWSHDAQERHLPADLMIQEFTRETGIRVQHLPAPETSPGQLELTRRLLEKRAVTPDVYGIDVIWPGILSEHLVDLKPTFASELATEDPAVLANYTVRGKLVAMPYHANTGVLYYRTDLLLAYGYKEPPRTWDELEQMAVRIQKGERAKGEKEFWGFVWPGAPSEGLVCNALEWQAGEGGGRIIEPDQTISVNNPDAIRAWERAEHWVGWISPPSVTSYQEWDASNAFWISGRAAFFRGWTSDYFLSQPPDKPLRHLSGVTSVPGGKNGRTGILGGYGLGVSQSSEHREEAVGLVRFLIAKEALLEATRSRSDPPKRPEPHELPVILTAYARPGKSGEKGASAVARPSTVTGLKYDSVALAYAEAVHSVLIGKTKAPEAAAALEKDLAAITGFKAGPR
jgi:trehalose/maltose transport system substrate-binding protein